MDGPTCLDEDLPGRHTDDDRVWGRVEPAHPDPEPTVRVGPRTLVPFKLLKGRRGGPSQDEFTSRRVSTVDRPEGRGRRPSGNRDEESLDRGWGRIGRFTGSEVRGFVGSRGCPSSRPHHRGRRAGAPLGQSGWPTRSSTVRLRVGVSTPNLGRSHGPPGSQTSRDRPSLTRQGVPGVRDCVPGFV